MYSSPQTINLVAERIRDRIVHVSERSGRVKEHSLNRNLILGAVKAWLFGRMPLEEEDYPWDEISAAVQKIIIRGPMPEATNVYEHEVRVVFTLILFVSGAHVDDFPYKAQVEQNQMVEVTPEDLVEGKEWLGLN